jgi:voltage-gated potassium channel
MSKLTKLARSATDTMIELLLIYAVLILIASALFAWFEGVGFGDSVWWSIVTATTTGYGDISPKTLGGRAVGFLLMHMAVFLIIPLIVARIITNFIENRDAFTHHEQEELMARLARIEAKLEERGGA